MSASLICALIVSSAGANGSAAGDYAAEIAKYRSDYEASLLKPRGWLSVAGLFWLNEGANTVGSAKGSVVRLPHPAPLRVGVIELKGKMAKIFIEPGVTATAFGNEFTEADLASDMTGAPTEIKVGDLEFHVIERSDKMGVRLYDPHCETRTKHMGLSWYAASEKAIVTAKYIAYDPPKPMQILNVLGQTRDTVSPGYVEFKWGGKTCRLDAEATGNTLFFNFKDKTNGKETYGAGRFLDAEKPKDGIVVLDFNKATNPPCAYTAFATCPLAPKVNWLDVEIKAGEKNYHLD